MTIGWSSRFSVSALEFTLQRVFFQEANALKRGHQRKHLATKE